MAEIQDPHAALEHEPREVLEDNRLRRDFVDDVGALLDGRRVGVMGFAEFRNAAFADLPGVAFFDLEYDVDAFDAQLPRVRVIPIDEFDPDRFLR